ncbi:MAG: hypothetical protein KIG88_06040, partial [Weeksellaceae bacterium]|nr:hypothetical protein [Weeksellaceae bacterium]
FFILSFFELYGNDQLYNSENSVRFYEETTILGDEIEDDNTLNSFGDEASGGDEINSGNFPIPAPINDYLPLLGIAAVGLGFYYRKELNQITK